eukprot:TRINITY_DN2697_c0_g1_i1.p1 TRINITY_DN2697_c0_g1~~TRINITY_DN2697_c0_g1_i1.p1  ORF type:complete len:237 (-),score=43.47 TRINITY_DN2697_c0_g1_i1:335-973(-)
MLGDSGVGKTCLLKRLAWGEFNPFSRVTIGIDFACSTQMIQGKAIKLQVWDTAGQDTFKSLVQSYFRRSHGAILAYTITSRSSFTRLDGWINVLREQAPDTMIIIVATKADLVNERQVSVEEGQAYAEKHKCAFLETSAQADRNVTEAFSHLASDIYTASRHRRRSAEGYDSDDGTITGGAADGRKTPAVGLDLAPTKPDRTQPSDKKCKIC